MINNPPIIPSFFSIGHIILLTCVNSGMLPYFIPDGWQLCDGSSLPISGHNTLFALIGSTFGGDCTTTFCLPNLTGPASHIHYIIKCE